MSRYKGFSSFDAMFSLVPVLMMLLFVVELASHFAYDAAEKTHRQQIFNKLVSVADYTVKSGAVRRAGNVKYPNWLVDNIDESYMDELREHTGLSRLVVSFHEPREDYSVCIYRLVVIGDDKKVARLFVCGE